MCDYDVTNEHKMCPISTSYKKIRTPNYVSHRKLLFRPVLKVIIFKDYNNILEISLTRSIARKPQSFGGFKKIGPQKLKQTQKLVFQKKLTGVACAPPRAGARRGAGGLGLPNRNACYKNVTSFFSFCVKYKVRTNPKIFCTWSEKKYMEMIWTSILEIGVLK